LELAYGGWKISPVKIDAAEDVLGAGMTRIAGDDGLGEMVGLADITSAEPGFRGIDGDVGIGGGEFQSFVQFASGFIKARFGDRKIGELAEAKSDGLVVVALGFGEVAGGERGLGGFKTALEKNGGIVGGRAIEVESAKKMERRMTFELQGSDANSCKNGLRREEAKTPKSWQEKFRE